MSSPNFVEALLASGFSSIEQINNRGRWQVWRAIERKAFSEELTHLLFLDSKTTWGISKEVARDIRLILPPGGACQRL